MARVSRIVSGGQTGADRAALDAAIAARIEYGGWCPADGRAEDHPSPPGVLPAYPALRPTDSADPSERTRRNVADSDATLIVVTTPRIESAGTELTRQLAAELGRPHLVVTAGTPGDVEEVRAWLDTLPCGVDGLVLNVAGPRESQAPGTYAATYSLMTALLAKRVSGGAG